MTYRLSELLAQDRALRRAQLVLPASGSLRQALDTQRPLALRRWPKREVEFVNKGWTGQCNGVTTDGRSWLVSSNRKPPPRTRGPVRTVTPQTAPTRYPGVFEVDDDGRVLRHHHIHRSVAGHVGDLDLHDGLVYVALEKPNQLWVLDRDLRPARQRRRIETPDGHFAWCAIHPWNGLLYTCSWNNADRLIAYDPRTVDPVPEADLPLDHTVYRVQGGAFSPDGQVFLACDDKTVPVDADGTVMTMPTVRDSPAIWRRFQQQARWHRAEPGIHAYSSATGSYVGHLPVEVHHGAPKFEEIEGVGYGRRELDGHEYLVHLVLLDQDPIVGGDDIHLKSYRPRG